MQFTEKYIQSLKPDKKARYDEREKSGNGFAIRVFPSGEKSWVFIYHFEGRKRRMTLGSYPALSLADARKIHRDAIKTLEKGKDPGLEKKQHELEARLSSTVEELIEEYITKWAKERKRSWQEDQRILNKDVKPLWGKRKAKDITRRDVILLLDKIKERGAPIAANRTFACVRRMFNFGIEQDIISSSPCIQIKAPSKENRIERCLSAEEIKTLWKALDEDIFANNKSSKHTIKMSPATKLILKFQLATAQRKGEIVNAEWCEFDLNNGWWTIPSNKAKNGYQHRVALSKLALDLLKEIKKLNENSQFLFPSRNNKPMTGAAIDHAVRRCKFKDIEHFSPHSLRRTSATHMTAMGIPRLVVSKILNHVDSGVTSIYDRHSYDNEKRNALEAWGKKLNSIVNDKHVSNNVISYTKLATKNSH